jgi:hypothetical protein
MATCLPPEDGAVLLNNGVVNVDALPLPPFCVDEAPAPWSCAAVEDATAGTKSPFYRNNNNNSIGERIVT